jgi:hypothetical protein
VNKGVWKIASVATVPLAIRAGDMTPSSLQAAKNRDAIALRYLAQGLK